MKTRVMKWFLAGSALVLGLTALLTPSAASLAKGPAQEFTCPTTSANTYVQGAVFQYDLDNPVRPAEENADKNIEYRGFGWANQQLTHLKNYGHSSDSALPPQIATLFRPIHVPRFVTEYQVNDWQWFDSPDPGGSTGDTVPFQDVSMLGLRTRPGMALHSPTHSRALGAPFGKGGAVVLYANEDSITLKFTREDSVARGYTLHITGICTDPNLLALYRSLDNADRNSTGPGSGNTPRDLIPDYNLPGLTQGQVFGVAGSREIQVAIRDEGTFLDPRSRNDWWRIR